MNSSERLFELFERHFQIVELSVSPPAASALPLTLARIVSR
jgi:hypothetical protein